MDKVIYKYDLVEKGKIIVLMPKGAKILNIQIQHGIPVLWAEIDPNEKEDVSHMFALVGTGHEFEPKLTWEYQTTLQLSGGALIIRVYKIN